jgi:hypothetical protein
MKLFDYIVLLLLIFVCSPVVAQNSLGTLTDDESHLYAQTKQVNQFFRRFNNEEDHLGNRYYPGDSGYRNAKTRSRYLNMLFDRESKIISKELKQEFIDQVSASDSPEFLNFRGDLWFAELAVNFLTDKKKESLILFLQLEQENLGYKWVITNVYYDKFLKFFYKGDKEEINKSFLHPMSHELDFMNIRNVFNDPMYVEYYASKNFKPDFRTLLFYEIKLGNMQYESVGQLKFHFFQVKDWYFEVSYFNRPGGNSGWLISKLYKLTDQEKNELIQFYLP